MAVIHKIIFSKDRPMQLSAYLDSFMFCTHCDDNIIVIIDDDTHYQKLMEKYAGFLFITEKDYGTFQMALNHVIANVVDDDDFVLFGCDDCIWTKMVHLGVAARFLHTYKDALGFSFRLGNNSFIMQHFGKHRTIDNIVNVWDWRNATGDMAYVFELMGTMYRASTVKDIILNRLQKKNIFTPNYLESDGVQCCWHAPEEFEPMMMCFNTDSYIVAQDINRVQHQFQNKFTGSPQEDPQIMIEKFNNGVMIDWLNLYNISEPKAFVGDKYLKYINN